MFINLILLMWRIWWTLNNASKWQMGFNSAFKGLKCSLTLILLTWRIWWSLNNASRWQMEFNSAFKGLKCSLTLILLTWRIWRTLNNASRWQIGFNSAFTGLHVNEVPFIEIHSWKISEYFKRNDKLKEMLVLIFVSLRIFFYDFTE